MRHQKPPLLALTQGDPAGIGPEILCGVLADWAPSQGWLPLLICEAAALDALHIPAAQRLRSRLMALGEGNERAAQARSIARGGAIPWLDPVAQPRRVELGQPGAADARGALRALDEGIAWCRADAAQALVTAPLSKKVIADHIDPSFRGHTDYLAQSCGLQEYGRDYLMAFLAEGLQVALLSTHVPLRRALELVTRERVVQALACLHRGGARRIALAGLNPHAGEGGLLGEEDDLVLTPAVRQAQAMGIDVSGPISPDTVFYRCRQAEYDWVLALYHDQGLIAVKTLSFGGATNYTLGLPFLRTSPDHGTAFDLAGRGVASIAPMQQVIRRTVQLLAPDAERRR